MIGNKNNSKGRLEVICGSMFSGKTEELITRIKKVELEKKKFIVFIIIIKKKLLFQMGKLFS